MNHTPFFDGPRHDNVLEHFSCKIRRIYEIAVIIRQKSESHDQCLSFSSEKEKTNEPDGKKFKGSICR
jgi:hypothetical protein